MNQIEEVKNNLERNDTISLKFKYITECDYQCIFYLSLYSLGRFDLLYISDLVVTILKEGLMNSNKANAKRIYFSNRHLAIKDPNQYEEGIKDFYQDVIQNWPDQEELLRDSNYFVTFSIQLEPDKIVYQIENNTGLLDQEKVRINQRIEASKKYSDLSEAFMDLGDNVESAGLGIVLTQLLLKNTGLGTNLFKIESDSKITRTTLTIPTHLIPKEIYNQYKKKIIKELDGIPSLPNSLMKIINLCNDPDSDIQLIAKEIEISPALASELLKLSNSSGLGVRNKVSTILQAIKIVGLRNVRNILYIAGVRKILNDKYSKTEEVWIHSKRCSFFAREIANEFNLSRYSDIVSVGGLLHDLGKLVLLSLDPKLLKQINSVTENNEINNVSIVEEISVGMSHATIGSLLAKKWKFPEDLSLIIEYHHRPYALKNHKLSILVEIVYLGNSIDEFNHRKMNYSNIDYTVLKKFNLETKDKFVEFASKLKKREESNIE